MAINIYSGVMGSGKSYEVVINVILPAIKKGRRVVTNIDGIDEEKIHAHIEKEDKDVDASNLGKVVHVTDQRIEEPNFFPTNEVDSNSVVKGGDLIVIDEAWRFWSAGKKLSDEHMSFFRMHRHYVHPETKISCDLALIFQSITDISRSLRSVVELHFNMRKLKTLGLSRSYVVSWYEGGKQTKAAFVDRRIQKYDKKIFPLYQSYAGGAGNESAIDSRQNLLLSKKTFFFVILFFCLIGFGGYFSYSFFHPKPVDKKKEEAVGASSLQSVDSAQNQQLSNAVDSSNVVAVKSSPGSLGEPHGVLIVSGERRVLFLKEDRIKFKNFKDENCRGRGVALECGAE